MYRRDVLHEDAPHDHDHHEPFVYRMAADEFHVRRCEDIQHHGGRDVPEGAFVTNPEVPVDEDVAECLPYPSERWCEAVDGEVAGYVVEAGYDEPCGIDADEASPVEAAPVAQHGALVCCLHPREPQSDAGEEEEDVNTDIAHATQSEEVVGAWQGDMEKYHHEHGGSHVLSAEA